MTYTFLGLTNRVLKAFNEVELTSANFASATGFHAEVKDAINHAILDIYNSEEAKWPFAWATYTFNTVKGQTEYTPNAAISIIDWNSFRLKRSRITLTSLTQSSGTATATVSAGHQLEEGDSITLTGATPTGYNLTVIPTINSTTTFTYAVDSSLASPATGTIQYYLPYSQEELDYTNLQTYRETYLERDANITSETAYTKPELVVRKADNSIILSGPPNRIYTVEYEAYSHPSRLTAYDDVPAIPSRYEDVIVDRAKEHAYMFRDNPEQAALANRRYTKGLKDMRRIEIPRQPYVRLFP